MVLDDDTVILTPKLSVIWQALQDETRRRRSFSAKIHSKYRQFRGKKITEFESGVY